MTLGKAVDPGAGSRSHEIRGPAIDLMDLGRETTLAYEIPVDNQPIFNARVIAKTNEIRDMLIEKNRAYGNSALDPVRVFSKAGTEEQILVRIDDKLSRLQRGSEYADEDTVKDLIGYLILLQIARES